MKQKIILDTGSLVASIDKSDRFHNWAKETWKTIPIPLFTCEAVISEAVFLLEKTYGGQDVVMYLLDAGVIQIAFRLSDEIKTVRDLMKRYQNVPMSLEFCLFGKNE